MGLHELLRAVPQSRNGLDVFIQAEHEAVLFVVLLHELERIFMNIAKEFDAWLDSPVVLVLKHQRVTEEETRLEATHVAITDRIAVDDLPSTHIFADSFGLLLINPAWERPLFGRYLSIMGLPGCQRSCDLFESLVKRLVVQEDPVIVVISVESVFDLPYGTSNLPKIRISGQSNKRCVCTLSRSGRGEDRGLHRCDTIQGICGLCSRGLWYRRSRPRRDLMSDCVVCGIRLSVGGWCTCSIPGELPCRRYLLRIRGYRGGGNEVNNSSALYRSVLNHLFLV